MNLAVLLTVAALLKRYFQGRSVAPLEAVLVGTMWFAINLAFDDPLFAFGPMKTTPRLSSSTSIRLATRGPKTC